MTKKLTKLIIIISLLFLLLLGLTLGLLVLFGSRLKDVLNQTPNYTARELYSNAVQQIDKGSYQSAETYLEQALLKEDDATYRNQLAVVKYRLKKYSESIDQYQKLIEQKKDVAFAWNGIGNAYRDWAEQGGSAKAQYQQKALNAYQQALTADPFYVAGYSNLAFLLNSLGQKTEALSVLDQGIALTKRQELSGIKATMQGQK